MASAAAMQHKERVAKAFAAMENLGLSRQTITPILKNLLKIYDNEWDFIEAENYRALADTYFDQLESKAKKTTTPQRPSTRASRALPETIVENGDDDGYFSPPTTPAFDPGIVKQEQSERTTQPNTAVAINVAQAVDYHSGASVLARTMASRPIPPLQSRSRIEIPGMDHNGSSSNAHESEKGKSPMISTSNGSPSTDRVNNFQRPLASAPSLRSETGSARPLVRVKLEVDPSVPTPPGFDPVPIETVRFERVEGMIVPSIIRSGEDDGLPGRNTSHNNVCSPAPLLAVDPATGRVHELQDGDRTHCTDNGGQLKDDRCPDRASALPLSTSLEIVPYCTFDFTKISLPADEPPNHTASELPINTASEQPNNTASELPENTASELPENTASELPNNTASELPNNTASELPNNTASELPNNTASELPNYSTSVVTAVPSLDPPSDMVLEEPGRSVLPCDQALGTAVEEDGPDPLLSLSGYGVDDELPETTEEGPSGGCDFVLMPDDSLLEPSDPPDQNAEGIRPNFILAGPTKREAMEVVEDATQRKRQRRERRDAAVAQSSIVIREAPLVQDDDAHPSQGDLNGEGDLNDGEIERQPKHNPIDISRGSERIPIPFMNEFTSETITKSFTYIASNVVYQDAYINFSFARIGDEDCCLECTGDCLKVPHGCCCTRETGGEFAYTQEGLLKPEYIKYAMEMTQDLCQEREAKMKCMTFCRPYECPIERFKNESNPGKCQGHYLRKFVKECWHKCGCGMECGNRVVQRGVHRRLQVFFTNSGKGWGIRTAEDLPAGAFVCEYVGEILTNMELDQRNQENRQQRKFSNQKDTYPILLDGDWCSEKNLKDSEALCLDATKHGNVARFINHRCWDANLIDIPVSIDSQDRHYYHVAFFTSRYVKAGEELTWDYKIDFDDDEHPIEAFQCLCNSGFCRSAAGGKKKKRKTE